MPTFVSHGFVYDLDALSFLRSRLRSHTNSTLFTDHALQTPNDRNVQATACEATSLATPGESAEHAVLSSQTIFHRWQSREQVSGEETIDCVAEHNLSADVAGYKKAEEVRRRAGSTQDRHQGAPCETTIDRLPRLCHKIHRQASHRHDGRL